MRRKIDRCHWVKPNGNSIFRLTNHLKIELQAQPTKKDEITVALPWLSFHRKLSTCFESPCRISRNEKQAHETPKQNDVADEHALVVQADTSTSVTVTLARAKINTEQRVGINLLYSLFHVKGIPSSTERIVDYTSKNHTNLSTRHKWVPL